MDGHVILNTQGVLDSAVVPAKGIRTGCPDAPSDGFVSHGEREIYKSVGLLLGVSRSTIVLRMVVRDHEAIRMSTLCQRRLLFLEAGPTVTVLLLQSLFGTYLFATVIPLLAFAGSLILISGLLGHCFGQSLAIVVEFCGLALWYEMAPKKTVSSAWVSEAGEKAIDKLDVNEFRERFFIPNAAPVPSADVVQGIPPLLQIPPIFIHPNLVRVLMGCSIINMLYSLDLTLLEVFFVYSLKKAKNDIFSLSAHLPSLQMVTELPDSTKGGAKGLVASGVGIQGPPCGLGGKGVLRLCLQIIRDNPKERAYKTLLSARNLIEVVRESQEYVINILPRKLSKDEIVPGEHYTVKELPLYQEAKEADAERRRKLLEDRDQKKTEGTIRKAPGQSGVRTLLQRKLQEKGGSW
ncbi:hypothetical protein CK203_012990 [Vitis vinifera]|uniref:Uncharacterized protein n=1 Tax=Vitis vinifera TaxID=29760 RepID=A0A438JLS7_VITVI|nr:hypothetical protein CK203_012990 [Vitis vinifera]